MTNENEKRDGKNTKRRPNDAREMSSMLMQNRFNISPNSAPYTIDNRMIEKVVTEFILANMEPEDRGRRFMVQCGWNRAYDRVIETGKQDGSDPFVISVFAEVTSRDRGEQKKAKSGSIMYRNIINRALREASAMKKKQISIMTSDRLNACLASLAFLNKRGEISWAEVNERKSRYVECPLDPIKVLEYGFNMDDPKTHDVFGFDIIDVQYKGKGKKIVDGKGRNPEFTMNIAKVRMSKNFKYANRDRFEFLARRRRGH